MNIAVTVKSVYGRPTIYPANDAARIIARIAGTKTLSAQNLADAKALDHTVSVLQDVASADLMSVLAA